MVSRAFCLLLLVSAWTFGFGQPTGNTKVSIGEWIHKGANAELTADKFIFLDFWATWCGPCLHSMPHVEQLMDIFKSDVFFVSMTKEGPITVERHLDKRPIRTAVALDYLDKSHDLFDINSIPEALLLSPSGRLIWRGHPSEMTTDLMRKKVMIHKSDPVTDLVQKIEIAEVADRPATERVEEGITFAALSESGEVTLQKKDGWIDYQGNIYRMINLLFEYPMTYMEIDSALAQQRYAVRMPESVWNAYPSAVLIAALDRFGLQAEMQSTLTKSWIFNVLDATKLWGDNIIEWGDDSPGYMIGDDQVEVDNRSVRAFCGILSEALGIPVITNFNPPSVHDWQLHIQYQDLMLEQLSTEYGIEMKQVETHVPKLVIIVSN